VSRVARTCILWLVCMVDAGALADSATRVQFENIEGAKRWDRDAGTWELAYGGPLQLFRDGRCLQSEAPDVVVRPGAPAMSLGRFPGVRPALSFTCALELAQGQGGVLTLQLCQTDGAIISERMATFGADGWLSVACQTPPDTDDDTALELRASATGQVTVTRVVLSRRFEQLFQADTPFPLQGMAWHKFGASDTFSPHFEAGNYRHHRTGDWRGLCPTEVRDGIAVGVLNKSYYPLLCTRLGAQAGVPVPVRGAGGCRLCWRGVGEYTLPIISDSVPTRAYKNERVGGPDGWHDTELALDPNFLDSSGNGIWNGFREYDWQCGTTLVTNYGDGAIDYLVLLPQNRIPLPPGTARAISLRYLNQARQWTAFTTPIPDTAKAVGLVFQAERRTTLWSETETGWQPLGTIPDGVAPNRLLVEPNSIAVSVPPP